MIQIRAARPTDKRVVRRICAQIWDEDYLPRFFDAWVRDRRGRLWVAVIDGRVVGVAKLSLVGDREAWLHALRVDPAYRRLGIAGALLAHRIARARRLGARVARLDTSSDNIAVRRLMRRHGFRRIARNTLFVAPARAVDPPERARRDQIDRLWRLVRRPDSIFNEDRVDRRVARADLVRAVRAGRCLIAGTGAVAIVQPYKDRLRLAHLTGKGRALTRLLRELRGEAKRTGKRAVAIGLQAEHWRAGKAAGYRRVWDDAMLVFEKRI